MMTVAATAAPHPKPKFKPTQYRMTMTFDSPGAFAQHLRLIQMGLAGAERQGLEAGITLIQREAQRMLGEYQRNDTGPFVPWAELAPFTKEEREEQGYPDNDPLLREGILRDNIEHSVGDRDAATGVPDREVQHPYHDKPVNIGVVAEVLEVGNERVPPRSFLGVAGSARPRRPATRLPGMWPIGWRRCRCRPNQRTPRDRSLSYRLHAGAGAVDRHRTDHRHRPV